MKSFLDHLKEEVLPSVQVADGGLDISKPAVRAAINAAIAGVVSQPAVTPYVVFNRLSKLLAQYHIVLPRRFLEGDKGVEVFELRQFGHKMGMTDSGEFVNEVPSTHYLFLQYGIITPFGVTYAKPVVGGMFKVMARVVDKGELDKLMDMAEITMAEEAECMQAIYKANAPKEEMHDITSDEKKKGNKEAVSDSQKGLDEVWEPITGSRRLAGSNRRKRKAVQMDLGRKHKGEEGWNDRTNLRHSALTMGRKLQKQGVTKEDKDPCWKGYEMIGMKKKGGKPVPNCVPVEEEEKKAYRVGATKKDKSGRTVERRDYSTHSSIVATHDKEGKSLQNKWGGYNPDRVGKPKYIQKHFGKMEEATDKDRELSKLATSAISKGHSVKKLPAGRAEDSVLPKRAMPKGFNLEKGRWSGHGRFNEEYGVYRKGGSIGEKPSTEPHKTFDNLIDAKLHAKGMNKQLSPGEKKYYRIKYHVKPLQKEETQLNELGDETLKSYKKGAKADRKLAKNILKKASTGHYLLGRRDDDKLDRTIVNRKAGIKLAKDKLARSQSVAEEQLDELTGKGKLPELKAVYKGDKDYHTRGANYHAARADRAERRGEVGKAERHMDAGYGHEHKAERAEAKSKRASALLTRAKAHADIKASKAASKSARAEYNEETQIDEISTKLARSYLSKATDVGSNKRRTQGVFRARGKMTGEPYEKVDKSGITVGHVSPKVLTKEEQIDELKKSTVGSYLKKAHVSGLAAADDAASAYHRRDYKELHKANRTGEKRESGVNLAADKLSGRARVAANEETIAEKAPPGAKFERMVKHIKKGYEKDGLTKKEKSIAYATAWKAKNREKGE